MDASMIRIICAAMAVLLIGVIVLRRRRRAE
jgi:MYXO-CTERM domain-containing protein